MIQEAYCSFEVAKLLEDKGFNILTNKVYDNQNKLDYQNVVCWQEKRLPYISAPTHQMACAWLREKGYHIYVFMLKDNIWVYEIQKLNEDWTYFFSNFRNYDKAIEAALKYVLKNLI